MRSRSAPLHPPRLRRTLILPALLAAVAACTDVAPPTATPAKPPPGPSFTEWDDPWYPPPFFTSTRDTCAGYVPPAELEVPFWSGTDEQWVSNPDSVWAADSAKVEDPYYLPMLAVIDEYTGAELYAGPCEVLYNRCIRTCRRLKGKAAALCWAACMARYAACLADEEVERRRRRRPPGTVPTDSCDGSKMIVYDPYEEEPCDPYYGGGGGGDGGGSTSNCYTEWVVVEVYDGTTWKVVWEGYATVCE
jgi:hypothetical protein